MSLGDTLRGPDLIRSLPLPAPIAAALAPMLGSDGAAATQRAALLAFVIRVASAGIAYLSQIFLARWMGSHEYGVFVFVWVWVLILGGLAPLGFSTSCTRFVPEYRETGRLELLRGLIRRARAITLASSTLIALAGAAGLALFGDMLADYYLLPAFLILVCLPMYALEDVQDGIARGYGWIDVALVPPFILRPLMLLLAMLGAYLFGLDMTAVTAAGAAIFATWFSAIVQTVQLGHRTRLDTGPGERAYETDLWVRTALPLLLFSGFVLLLQNTDVLVLSRYVDPSQVAIYFAALKTISLIAFVHFAVGAATANRFAAHNARGEGDALQEAVRNAAKWTFWPSLAGAVLLLLLGKPLLWLFGPEFTSGYAAMFVLAAGLVLRAAAGPVELLLNMLGHQKICAAMLFTAVALNLALNFALIPAYGLIGAATATAISMAAAALGMALFAQRKLGLTCFVWPR